MKITINLAANLLKTGEQLFLVPASALRAAPPAFDPDQWAQRNLPQPAGARQPYLATDLDGAWCSYDEPPTAVDVSDCWCATGAGEFGFVSPFFFGVEPWPLVWHTGYFKWNGTAWNWHQPATPTADEL